MCSKVPNNWLLKFLGSVAGSPPTPHRFSTHKRGGGRKKKKVSVYSDTARLRVRGNGNVFFVCSKPVFHPLKYNIGVRGWVFEMRKLKPVLWQRRRHTWESPTPRKLVCTQGRPSPRSPLPTASPHTITILRICMYILRTAGPTYEWKKIAARPPASIGCGCN